MEKNSLEDIYLEEEKLEDIELPQGQKIIEIDALGDTVVSDIHEEETSPIHLPKKEAIGFFSQQEDEIKGEKEFIQLKAEIKIPDALNIKKKTGVLPKKMGIHEKEKNFQYYKKKTIRTIKTKRKKILIAFFVLFFYGVFSLLFITSTTLYAYNSLSKISKNTENFSREISTGKNIFFINSLLIRPISWVLDTSIYSNTQIRQIQEINTSGYYLLHGFKSALQLQEIFLSWEEKDFSFLYKEKKKISSIIQDISKGSSACLNIPDVADTEKQKLLSYGKNICSHLKSTAQFLEKHPTFFSEILGKKSPKHIVILNQNRDEIRPGGGFPGTLFRGTIDSGKIYGLEMKDIYYFTWKDPYFLEAPEGIRTVNPKGLFIHDSNYSPFHNETYKTFNHFYTHAENKNVDILIGIHQGIIEDILKKYNKPIHILGVGDITYENFSSYMSISIESKLFKDGKSPKDILEKFSDIFLEKMHEPEFFSAVLQTIWEHTHTGQIWIETSDTSLEKSLHDFFPKPAYEEKNKNFLAPVFMSVGGNKSDRYMNHTFTVKTDKKNSCKKIVTLDSFHSLGEPEIQKMKLFMRKIGIYDEKEQDLLLGIQGRSENFLFIQMLLPAGSKIISGNPGQILNNLPTVSWYQKTQPGNHSSNTFSYLLPENFCDLPFEFSTPTGVRNITVVYE